MNMITWECPRCCAHNADDLEMTAIPICSDCDEPVEWNSILGDDDE